MSRTCFQSGWLLTCIFDSHAAGGVTVDVNAGRISNAAMEAAQAELEGRTGLTDSEDESAE